MAIFKCKICGGTLEITSGETVATCEYCGTKQTVPKCVDENLQGLFNRANILRMKSEFDKAEQLYEKIIENDEKQAEAYWGLILCKYGIEYVDDPVTFKKVPTCHRASYDSIIADEDYKSALENADISQRAIYEEQAKEIDRIQKEILALAQNEEPFDVFICYKETDNDGKRTVDSVVANDIYHQLSQEGFKVFYAAISLENKLGSAYEPYIFAALNSAKVMLVVGTKPEYFNAVWVKNEWSRFLKIVQKDRSKLLIPCYRDMDAYELPEEFAHLQAQDMSKIGFINDVVRGVKKVVSSETKETPIVVQTQATESATGNVKALLERGFMALEDGEWKKADDFFEQALNFDAKLAEAYLGKLMSELRVNRKENLRDCSQPFESMNNYGKVMRFGDEKLKSELSGFVNHINERNENARLEGIYSEAEEIMSSAVSQEEYKEAAELFESVNHYKDSAERAKACREKAEIARKDGILAGAKEYISNFSSDSIDDYEDAISLLKQIPCWKNADELIVKCNKKIEEIKAKQEAERLERERLEEIAKAEAEARAKKNKKIAMIVTPILCVLIAFWILWTNVIVPNMEYNDALDLMEAEKYEEAISAFEAMDGYKDSAKKIAECETGFLDNKYDDALALMDAEKLDEAYTIFIELEDYKDAIDKAGNIRLTKTKDQLKNIKVGSYINFGAYEQDNNTSNGKEDVEWLVLEVKDGKALVISKYALDRKQYNTSYASVTWETCTLRKWLNNDFLDSAFSANEKAMIPTVTVSADKNPNYSTNPGNATQDQVFLLSITEANKYFSSDSARQCKPTDYADAGGAFASGFNGNCWWWLRSPGDIQYFAAYVYNVGDVREFGYYVDDDFIAVRPALWLDISKTENS